MFKYFHILKFLMMNDLDFLKECWLIEHMHTDKFTWKKLIVRIFKNAENRNYYFWWRLANEMFTKGTEKQKIVAKKIQLQLVQKYNTEIQLGAKIGIGLTLAHFMSIQITCRAEIGDNFYCHQMINIALNKDGGNIKIGNNVMLGCGSVILGGKINIGNNVKIGAMSFINKDIPDDCTVYTEKTNKLKIKSR